ncbi:RNA-guided endonuclease TnpB family protein [Homoserinimonas sp. OAct 916]|uniref:RNA-guided endonuclease InsQ/TnpB family protein n=1 Tax=Homoserinimonas sp. OAct 916 TaxID=2211450 RepID=UPI0018E54035|nr:RNA-guided endonuclease TnpB family protein [Homoserinimonas sp. OAct 916]
MAKATGESPKRQYCEKQGLDQVERGTTLEPQHSQTKGWARYRYRIYPNALQQEMLARLFECVRLVFNDFLAANDAHVKVGPRRQYRNNFALSPSLIAQAKNRPERACLKEVPAAPLQQALADGHQAYRNAFDSATGKRKGEKIHFPKFKSRKDNRQTARFTRNTCFAVRPISSNRAMLRLPRMGDIDVVYTRDLPSEPTSVTIIREADGRYHASFVVTRETTSLPPLDRVAGLDLGLIHLATIVYSDGTREKIPAPQHFRKRERKLARVQRLAARQKERAKRAKVREAAAVKEGRATATEPTPTGHRSNAHERARRKVASAHRKVRDARSDFHHKLADRIVHENQVICLETLNITGLARTRLAKSIHDAGWGALIRLIEEKAARYGRTVIRIDRATPTSQTCSVCGINGGKKSLNVRAWGCSACGAWLDRDYNAAVNIIVAAGHAEMLNAGGEDIRLRLSEATPQRNPKQRISVP